MKRAASPSCTGSSSSERFPRSLPPTSSHHHLPHPQFEALNFFPVSSASQDRGFQTVLPWRSQPRVSSLSTETVKFTSQGESGLEKQWFTGEAHCSAAEGSASWWMGVSDGPGTQGPPDNSWSDPASGGLASQLLSPFSALQLLAVFLDFFKNTPEPCCLRCLW